MPSCLPWVLGPHQWLWCINTPKGTKGVVMLNHHRMYHFQPASPPGTLARTWLGGPQKSRVRLCFGSSNVVGLISLPWDLWQNSWDLYVKPQRRKKKLVTHISIGGFIFRVCKNYDWDSPHDLFISLEWLEIHCFAQNWKRDPIDP